MHDQFDPGQIVTITHDTDAPRREFWRAIFLINAERLDDLNGDLPAMAADFALAAYDKRFPKED